MSHTTEHCSEGEDGGHAHGNSARHCIWRNIERQVSKNNKECGGYEGLEDVVAQVPLQSDLHDDARIVDIILISDVAVMKVNHVSELIKMNAWIHLKSQIFFYQNFFKDYLR